MDLPDLPDQDRLWVYEELLPIRDRFGFRSGAWFVRQDFRRHHHRPHRRRRRHRSSSARRVLKFKLEKSQVRRSKNEHTVLISTREQ